jgi:Tol biopolymer transport system component
MGRVPRGVTALGASLCACALLALPANAARDDLDLVNIAPGGAAANGGASDPAISADGRLVAFESTADNLSAEDDNGVQGIFVRALPGGASTLVSRATGATGAGANGSADDPAISADDRFVVFQSTADNLATDDDDAVTNIFVRDLTAGTTTLVSRMTGATGAGGNGNSFDPSISGDGRVVAFMSLANNLSSEDDDGVGFAHVFVRDLQAGTTTLVSRESGPAGAVTTAESRSPTISADGRLVAFASRSTNLSAEDSDNAQDVFVRDLQTATTTLASRAVGAGGATGDGDSSTPVISADGRAVVFVSVAANLSDADGAAADVFVRDLQASTTTLVSRASGVTGAGADGAGSPERPPAISSDGRFVAFNSNADNLSASDANGVENVFVRDLLSATTTLVSRRVGAAGAGANGGSSDPAISGDGGFVAFRSAADNLSSADDNGVTNVFRREVLGTATPPVVVPTARCRGRAATIVGTARADVLKGTAGSDVIAARGGDDLVKGGGGDDLICLGTGRDRVLGGTGSDRIFGQGGADRLDGGLQGDRLDGGPGRDRIVGGGGGDDLFGRAGADLLLGGPGFDQLIGGIGRDTALGGSGSDFCTAERRRSC